MSEIFWVFFIAILSSLAESVLPLSVLSVEGSASLVDGSALLQAVKANDMANTMDNTLYLLIMTSFFYKCTFTFFF